MKKFFMSGIFVFLITIINANYASAMVYEGPMLNPTAIELRLSMRKLWEDHITYTRNYIISDLGNLGDKSKIAERLLRNQVDIGNAIKPIYGEEAGNQLTTLLKEHIVLATKVIIAARAAKKGGQSKALTKAQADWTKNGDDIATFLSGANPNWKKSAMLDMLTKHLEYTTDEVSARLSKNWDKDIEAYDLGHDHMLMFADELASGIVKQFPDKFVK